MLGVLGPAGNLVPPLLVLAVLALMQLARREKWRTQRKAVIGMAVESLLWMAPLVALMLLRFHPLQSGRTVDWKQEMVAGVGAGVYEEFIFRLLMVSGMVLLLTRVARMQQQRAAVVAVVVAAVAFSLYHFSSWQDFNWSDFVTRASPGSTLGDCICSEGSGSRSAHAAYDVFRPLLG